MDGLVDAVALALPVGDTTQAGARQQANASRNDRGLVANDITKQVACDDDTVQAARVLDHDHSSTVNQLVAELELGKLLLEDLSHHFAP